MYREITIANPDSDVERKCTICFRRGPTLSERFVLMRRLNEKDIYHLFLKFLQYKIGIIDRSPKFFYLSVRKQPGVANNDQQSQVALFEDKPTNRIFISRTQWNSLGKWSSVSSGDMSARRADGSEKQGNNVIVVCNVPFQKIKLIGTGYQSMVFEARKLHGRLRCALKMVKLRNANPREQQNLQNTFVRELNFMAKLNNQSIHIARVYGYDIDRINMVGRIVMELGSRDLRSLLPLRAPAAAKIIPEPKRRHIWRQMVEALVTIHLNGVTHCDVKPENFIFVHDVLKIIDFGMSFVVPAGKSTCRRPFAGTPDYMPPEVCRPVGVISNFGFKADIWSLGCVLFEMTFGKRPFEHIDGHTAKMRYIGSLKSLTIPKTTDYLLYHVLKWCLQPTEYLRPSAQQLLNHPYIQPY